MKRVLSSLYLSTIAQPQYISQPFAGKHLKHHVSFWLTAEFPSADLSRLVTSLAKVSMHSHYTARDIPMSGEAIGKPSV
jgi:hypothetical protein